MDVAGIIFQNNNYETITVLSVYIDPSQTLNTEHLNRLLTHKKVFILGDFNAKTKLWDPLLMIVEAN